MRVLRSLAAVTLAVIPVVTVPFALRAQMAAPQHSNRIALEQYLDWEEVQAPQLSPDGTQILFGRRWVDKMNDRWESSVWLMNADGTHQRSLVQGSDVHWSPDGKRIAYVAKGEPSGQQIFVRWMDAEGAVTQISHVTETPASLEWSPDGKSIAFTMNVPVKETWRIAMPTPPKGAKWIESPKIVTRLNYRSDRVGFTDDAYRHIFLIPADGGTPRQITNGDWNHSAPAFSADGKWIAFSGLREPNAENFFRKSQIYAANLETGEIRQITHRNGTNGNPVYSPDGKMIAFMSADSVDHSAWAETKLWAMNADGSGAHVLSGNLDRPISGVSWAPDGSGVYFNVESEGSKNLYFATPTGQFHPVTSGKQVLTVNAVGKTGVAVGIRSTPTKPNDVVSFAVPKTGTASTFTQLTAVNDDVLAGKELAQTEEIWYTSKDGLKVQGWVVKPPGFDPSKKYPLILDIHGGPQAMYNVAFSFARQDHAANGLRRALHESARQHGLRREVHQRDQERVPGQGLRRSHGRRRHRRGTRLRRHEEHVRVRLLGRRRVDGVDRRPHESVRRGRVALPGDRLDQLRRRDGRRGLVRELRQAVLGGSEASTSTAHRSCTSAT